MYEIKENSKGQRNGSRKATEREREAIARGSEREKESAVRKRAWGERGEGEMIR